MSFNGSKISLSIFVIAEEESNQKDSKPEEEEQVIHEDERPSEKSKPVHKNLN